MPPRFAPALLIDLIKPLSIFEIALGSASRSCLARMGINDLEPSGKENMCFGLVQ